MASTANTADTRTRERARGLCLSREAVLLSSVVGGFAAFWAACSILIHRSFHSNGWDLGLINQVIWNTANGRPFEYSFRDMSYSGDHFQPVLYALVPLQWLGTGPEALLVVQALALAFAAVPLYLAVRKMAGVQAAWVLVVAYLLGLGVSRAVSFDFHFEAFAPLLTFGALWCMVTGRSWGFVLCGLLILTLKEDAALLTLALCWVAWLAFRERRAAAVLAGASMAYALLANYVVVPHYRGDGLNPFLERYSYLGDSPAEALLAVFLHPDRVVEQLARWDALEAVLLVVASSAFLPLLTPRLLPALGVVVLVPLLSLQADQGSLSLHYFLVPSTLALVIGAVAVRDGIRSDEKLSVGRWQIEGARWPAGLAAMIVGLFLVASPLPPSPFADWDRFNVDSHARLANSFVEEIPADATVSAQSPFVAHLSKREDIYQFPRVLDADYVLLDSKGQIPQTDLSGGYYDCLAALPRLGFDITRSEDGITLWEKRRPSEQVPEAPLACSGQHP